MFNINIIWLKILNWKCVHLLFSQRNTNLQCEKWKKNKTTKFELKYALWAYYACKLFINFKLYNIKYQAFFSDKKCNNKITIYNYLLVYNF
jgi:hypothetical protein